MASAEPGVFFANFGPPPPERPPPAGFHEVELNKTRWVIPKIYDRLTSLGEGAYGVVWDESPLFETLKHTDVLSMKPQQLSKDLTSIISYIYVV
ncbi:hypothetical protein ANCCEY_04300 [Ancylostoma ceylanicum]|uniref:Uncharacterized protein n=1 Tax=Ancylostoma ceylanicum TaxID=53326 RepID=A0A0D6M2P4_9BILA|nr:hypothetical protein ANCCEY_04300 [Ancylostoma ceylanicum]